MTNYHKPRIRKAYSDRTGLASFNKAIQIEEFDSETRRYLQNQLLNLIDAHIWNNRGNFDTDNFMSIIAFEVFNLEADSRKYYSQEQIFNMISSVFKRGQYFEILDIIEYFSDVISFVSQNIFMNKEKYCGFFNDCFEEEYVGYRFVDGVIVQSVDQKANKSIEDASNTKYDIVNKHIKKAVDFISESNKDPENSIKESVAAVEYLCNMLAGTTNFELTKALTALNKKKQFHPCMKAMIEKLYGFASDEEGIRHSTKESTMKISFNDALFILITCSAFINYALSI